MSKAGKRTTPFIEQMARAGCIATGIVYATIGIIALLSLLQLKHGGADESSILKFFEGVPGGKIVIGIILLGMVAYILWRFYEAIEDPYQYGRKFKGMAARIITAFSAVSDAMIAWPAIEVLTGASTAMKDGEPVAQRQMYGELLQTAGGKWVVMLIGIITSITAIVQFVYVFKEAYEERIDMKQMKPVKKNIIHTTGYAGHFARGIILGIMGFFTLKAAFTLNAHYVVNTDKAFDFIGDEISHLLFAAVAFGTICYGLFMFAMGYYYDFKKGK
ncbi:MAG: hypothetical protein JWR72_3825 [Flavisolibacter sp.]|jgi:hypothetical protein|nr:hypothetical protein [Flavisolibacter sp.]